ncbi:MAG TPA: dihydrolipoamide succinyltransferase, partial [Planctomycetaceae bacterium]|nr:dihydrolipoamide succinyltransferase [Planctomycetaceae bacterium]
KEDALSYQEPGTSDNGAFREEEIVPMSPIRKKIAERLVEAQSNAALLTTFNEVDMSAVMELRSQYKDMFLKKYDVKLGFMSF